MSVTRTGSKNLLRMNVENRVCVDPHVNKESSDSTGSGANSKDSAEDLENSKDSVKDLENSKDSAKDLENSKDCTKGSESSDQGCHKNHEGTPTEATHSGGAIIDDCVGVSESSDQRFQEKKPAEATHTNDIFDESEEETELDLLNMEDFEVVDAFEEEEDPSEFCSRSRLPTSGAGEDSRDTQVTHTSATLTDKSNRSKESGDKKSRSRECVDKNNRSRERVDKNSRSRESGDKRSRVHSSKDSSDLRNKIKSSESSRRDKRDDSRRSENSHGRYDTRRDQRKIFSDRPVDEHHSVRSSNNKSSRKRDYQKSTHRNSDSQSVCVREEKNYCGKESFHRSTNKQTDLQLSDKQNAINIQKTSQNKDQKVNINKSDVSDHRREASSASCGSRKVDKNELESKHDCQTINERSDNILDFLLEKDLAQGESSIHRELRQVTDDCRHKEESSKQTNKRLKQDAKEDFKLVAKDIKQDHLKFKQLTEDCNKKCIKLNSQILESKVVRISKGLNKDSQSESTKKDSKVENSSSNQAQNFNLKLLQETEYSNENSNAKQTIRYSKQEDMSEKDTVGSGKENGKSKQTSDKSKWRRDESKKAIEESKEASEESKEVREESKEASEESKEASEESKEESEESQQESLDHNQENAELRADVDSEQNDSTSNCKTGITKLENSKPELKTCDSEDKDGKLKMNSEGPKRKCEGVTQKDRLPQNNAKGSGLSNSKKSNQKERKLHKDDMEDKKTKLKIKTCDFEDKDGKLKMNSEGPKQGDLFLIKAEETKKKSEGVKQDDRISLNNTKGSICDASIVSKQRDSRSRNNAKGSRWDNSKESKQEERKSQNDAKVSRWDNCKASKQEQKKSLNYAKGSRWGNSKASKQDGKSRKNRNDSKQEDSRSKQEINPSKLGRDSKSKQGIKDTKKNSLTTLENDACDMEGLIDKYLESIRKEYATTTKEHVPDNDKVCKKVFGEPHMYRFSKVVIIGDSRIKILEDIGMKSTFGPLEIKCVPDLSLDNLEEVVKSNVDESNCPRGILLVCSVGIYDMFKLENNLSCKDLLDHEPIKVFRSLKYRPPKILNKVLGITQRLKDILRNNSRVYFTTVLPIYINRFNEYQANAHLKATGHNPAFPDGIQKNYNYVEYLIKRELDKFNSKVSQFHVRGDLKIIPWNLLPSNPGVFLEDGINPSRDAVEKYMVPMLKCTIKQYHMNRYQEFVIIGDSRLQKVEREWHKNYGQMITIYTQRKLSFGALTDDNPIVKEITGKKDALIVLSLGMYDILKFVAQDGCDSHKIKLELPSLCLENLDSSDKLWNDFVHSLKSVDQLLRKVTTNCDVIITTIYPFDFVSLQNYLVEKHAEETGHHVTIPSQSTEIKDKLNRIGHFILGINRIAYTLAEVKQLPVWDFNSLVFDINQPADKVPLFDGFHPTRRVAKKIAFAYLNFVVNSQGVCCPELNHIKIEDDAEFDKILHMRQPDLSTVLKSFNFDLSVPPICIEKKSKSKSDEKHILSDYSNFIKEKVLLKICSILRLTPNVYMSMPLPDKLPVLKKMKRESTDDVHNSAATRGKTSTASVNDSRESTYRTKSRSKYSSGERASPTALSSSPHRRVSEKREFRTKGQNYCIRSGSSSQNRHLESLSPSSMRLSSPDYQTERKNKFKWDEADSVIRNKLSGNYTVNYTDSSFTICQDEAIDRPKSKEWLGRNSSPSRSWSTERRYCPEREPSPWRFESQIRHHSADVSYSEEESSCYDRKSYSPERSSRWERRHSPVKLYPLNRDETLRQSPRRSCSPVQHSAHSLSDRVSSERLRQDRKHSPWKREMRSPTFSPHWKRSRSLSRSRSISCSRSHSSRGRRKKYGSSRGRRGEHGSKHSVIVRALHSMREVHDRECDMYRKKPKAHPNYTKEYKIFVDKKRERILSIGGDPNMYDMTNEWEVFWKSRMETVFNECWTVKRDECLSMLPVNKSYSRSPSTSCSVSSDRSSDASSCNYRNLRKKRAKHSRSPSVHRKKKVKKIRKNREKSDNRGSTSHYEDKGVQEEKRGAKHRGLIRKGKRDGHFQSPKHSSSETSLDNDILTGEKGSSCVASQRLNNVKDTKEKLGMKKMEGIINELLQQVIEPVNPVEHVAGNIATSEKTSSRFEDSPKKSGEKFSQKDGQIKLHATSDLTEEEVSSTTPSEGFTAEVIKVLELLSHLGERLGALQSPVKILHEKALMLKSSGLDTMKIFDEIDNKILLHMAADKLRNALQGGKLNIIEKIITHETEQKLSLLLEKEKDRALLYDLNIDSIASACLGKSTAETTTFIENALMYLGHTEVPQDQLMRIHMAVKTEQAKIFSLSKNMPQGRDCVISKPLQIPVQPGEPSHYDTVPTSQHFTSTSHTSVPPPSLGSVTYSQSHVRNSRPPLPVAPVQQTAPKPAFTTSQAPPQPSTSQSAPHYAATTPQTAPHYAATTPQMVPQPVPPPVIMPGSHTFGSSAHAARAVVSEKLSLTDFLSSISSSTVKNSVKL